MAQSTFHFDTLAANNVPSLLKDHMKQEDWQHFHGKMCKVYSEVSGQVCRLACCLCVCCGCPCCLCCQTWIQDYMGQGRFQECCDEANRFYFNKERVLTVNGHMLTINTTVISQSGAKSNAQQMQNQPNQQGYSSHNTQQSQVQPEYFPQSQLSYPQNYGQGQQQQQQQQQFYPQGQQQQYYPQGQQQQYSQYPQAQMVQAHAPIHPTRQGQYVVSDASVVGTNVTLLTPEGQQLIISVPPNCPVGSIIGYTY